HAWLRDPGPIHPPPPRPEAALGLGHGPADRAVRAVEAEHLQLLVADIGADLALGPLHPLLDLRQERVDDPLPPLGAFTWQPPLVALGDIRGDGVMRTAGQLTGIPERPCQIERFEYLHDLLARLHLLLLLDGHWSSATRKSSGRSTHTRWTQARAADINAGRTPGRQWAELMATSGQLHGRHRARSHGRRHVGMNRAPRRSAAARS